MKSSDEARRKATHPPLRVPLPRGDLAQIPLQWRGGRRPGWVLLVLSSGNCPSLNPKPRGSPFRAEKRIRWAGALLTVLLAVAVLMPSGLMAQDDLDEVLERFDDEGDETDIGDVLSGFEDEALPVDASANVPRDTFWRLTGAASLGPSFNVAHDTPAADAADYRGLTRLRLKLQLDLDVSLPGSWKVLVSGSGFHDFAYLIKGRDDFTDDVLDAYEQEIELREAYIQGTLLPNLDLRFGRQIVNWGRADNSRVLDVLNPLDLREPGMVDIEDLRLPLVMTRLDYLLGKWTATGIAIHEIRFNKEPVFGSEFFPLDRPAPAEEIPDNTLKNTELAAAINGFGVLSGLDVSLHFARFFDDQAHVEREGTAFKRRHSRLSMFGTGASFVKSSWLFKAELAYFDGLRFFSVAEEKSRIDALFGVEYTGISNTTLALDVVNQRIIDFEAALENPPDNASENTAQYVLTWRSNLRRETVHIVGVVSLFGWKVDDGAFERLSVEYDWTDALSVSTGVVLYQSGDNPLFKQASDSDRIFAEARYSF